MAAQLLARRGTTLALALVAVGAVAAVVAFGPRVGAGRGSEAARNVLGTAIPTLAFKVHDAGHLSVSTVAVGTTIHVSLVATGSSGTPTGGVGINRYDGATCAGTPTGGTKAVLSAGKVDGVVSTTTATVGSVSFKGRYGGSSTYAVRDTACLAVSITKAKPTIATTIHSPTHLAVTTVTLGTVIHSRAVLSGPVGTPTGLAGVNLYAGSTCAGSMLKSSGPQPLVGGELHFTSPSQVTTGSAYSFKVTYLGDAKYAMTTGPCKQVTVVLPT